MTPLFASPGEIRRAIYTTDVGEILNSALRNVIQTRGSFLSEKAALLGLGLRNVAQQWPAAPDWRLARNHFLLRLGDRIEAALAGPGAR